MTRGEIAELPLGLAGGQDRFDEGSFAAQGAGVEVQAAVGVPEAGPELGDRHHLPAAGAEVVNPRVQVDGHEPPGGHVLQAAAHVLADRGEDRFDDRPDELGAGKTTSLSMAVGLLRPDGGTVRVFGRDVWADPVGAKTLIGVLPDGMALPDRLTGREILRYLGLLRGLPRDVVEMRSAVMRRQALTVKGALGVALLVLIVTLLALATLAAGLKHYRYDGAGANVVATLCFGWLLGWVSGPLLVGAGAALRMDYFKLLPIPARKLGYAMLGAAFADVSLVFSLVAFAALIALGAQAGAGAALIGVAAVALPVIVLFPAAALLIPGAIGHSLLLRWLAVPVAIAWAAFLGWYSTGAAVRRLEARGPEIFTRVRA
jgi:hypothetical protein